eukprot:NODE_25642_length_580_cov_1.373068.p1 GENE.NODE_25642_length_580_cov_1.373068~~NODE_25642_length_580_cov_1.373068.p1  ORF type:complete len:118 (-),score=27.16 NODE_25642_length_580_cov_1.373068:49-402(-)
MKTSRGGDATLSLAVHTLRWYEDYVTARMLPVRVVWEWDPLTDAHGVAAEARSKPQHSAATAFSWVVSLQPVGLYPSSTPCLHMADRNARRPCAQYQHAKVGRAKKKKKKKKKKTAP